MPFPGSWWEKTVIDGRIVIMAFERFAEEGRVR
jgi:hypothetical protein